MNKKDKKCLVDTFRAWLNGKDIQFYMPDQEEWADVDGTPLWAKNTRYRAKPKEEKKILTLSINNKVTDVILPKDSFVKSIAFDEFIIDIRRIL